MKNFRVKVKTRYATYKYIAKGFNSAREVYANAKCILQGDILRNISVEVTE